MRAVIQRAAQASVEVDGRVVSQIGRGMLVYLSVGKNDSDADAEFMAEKLINLRIFSDELGKMNRGIKDAGGDTKRSGEPRRAILLVSNFTLHGDCRKGRRPGFDGAAEPTVAERLYEKTIQLIAEKGVKVSKGVFGANMQVSSINDGPVTFLLDSSLTREILP